MRIFSKKPKFYEAKGQGLRLCKSKHYKKIETVGKKLFF
jgi:hypothetical protein